MLVSKFVKFLMSILKRQVNSSPNFASLFSVMKYDSLYLFSSSNIYFAQKESIKVKLFGSFECLCQNLSNSSCQFWNGKSIPLQILHHSSVSWNMSPLYFFSSKNMYFASKMLIKVKIFRDIRVLGSKFVKFLMSSLKRQVISSLNITSFFIVMTQSFSVNFLLLLKGSHKSPNFETFKCSGENFPYYSCHFSNHKSVFLQILHDSSVSWKITPLYFFKATLYTLHKRNQSKSKFWEFQVLR